jgi:hypothetical protein
VRSCVCARPLSLFLTHLYTQRAQACVCSCLFAGTRALSLSFLTQLTSIMGYLPWRAGADHRRLRDLFFVFDRGGAFTDR